MDLALLALLILLNGIFAMSELALVTARRGRLRKLADDGDKAAERAIRLGDEPTQFLSTVQIGITAIGILNGIVGATALGTPLTALLQSWGMEIKAAGVVATGTVVVCITYVSIVLGELVPKRLAQFNPEGIARSASGVISTLAMLSKPFVFLLAASTDGILRLLGKHGMDEDRLTEDDIHSMLKEGSEEGLIEQQEHEMLRNVIRLDDRPMASMMTPRADIVFVDIEEPPEAAVATAVNSEFSRFPVCRGDLHDTIGVITANGLLKWQADGANAPLDSFMQPAVFVPETLNGLKLLAQFRESGVQMVLVVDEYGEVNGMITLQDVLEALSGEFTPRDPDDSWAIQREDGSWLLDGMIPLHDLKDKLDMKRLPEEERGGYRTLNGMMMWIKGGIPTLGYHADWEEWRLEVVDLDGNRIDKVLASRLPEPREAKDVDAR